MLLRHGAFHRRDADAVSVPALLLRPLPENGRRHRCRRENPRPGLVTPGRGSGGATEYAAPDATRTRFCSRCGSALYLTIDSVTDFVYPFASAVDTPLPEPPERVHVFTAEAPAWAEPPSSPNDLAVERNSNASIEG
jgi:hypothetical protein